MKINLNSNDIHEVLKLSKADKVSFINQDGITYIIAQYLKDDNMNQVVKQIYGYGDPGQTLINRNILKLVPKYTEVEITEDTITAGKRKIKYAANDLVDRFIEVENYLTTIPAGELKHLLSGYYAMYTSLARPILCGICINGSDFVACDGFRLTVRTGNFEAKEQVVMDINLVNTLKKIKYDKDVEVYYNDRFIKFQFGDLEVIGNRLEGEYFNYKSILPEDCTTSTTLETKPILDILKEYKKNKFELVKLNFTKDKLVISSSNEAATVKDKLPINLQGEPIEIMFNVNYLVDTFNNYEIVTLELTTNESPMMVKSENKLDLVLPVRMVKQ